MADVEYRSESVTELTAAWKKVVARFLKAQENAIQAQAELSSKIRELAEHWIDRMQSKANLASEFTAKLAGARSIPDAAVAWQEWGTRWLRMFAEDPQLLLTDSETLSELARHVLANAWLSEENWPAVFGD